MFSRKSLALLIVSVLIFIIFVEYVFYYLSLLQCTWPLLANRNSDPFVLPSGNSRPLKVLILTDSHISSKHDWLYRFMRERLMKRAFQTSLFIHNPDVVIHLGDVLDFGFFEADKDFELDVAYARDIFQVNPATTVFKVVAGNHDIGFHHRLHPYTYFRFWHAFMDHPDSPAVKIWAYGGLLFVFVNSMGLHGDDCVFCQHTEYYLHQVEQRLKCLRGDLSLDDCKTDMGQSSADDPVMDKTSEPILPGTYSRPILLQHFPLYRPDETVCEGGHPDSMPSAYRNEPFAPKNDCLTDSTSKRLLQAIQPRLVLDGHSHYGCQRRHEIPGSNGKLLAEEWTVPAFTWYDSARPGFLLLHISQNDYAVNKCLLPSDVTIVLTYVLGFIGTFLFIGSFRIYRMFPRLQRSHVS
uniref:Metallophosphoesterase 1 n=1 Tax=Schistocephalus solidus TaxID=70667 RepID=A0A0V0J734_SCHSO